MTAVSSNCRLLVGTSGYSYAEWAEAGFYPTGTPASKMLSHYVRSFKITELNYTWYQMPKAQSIDRMRQSAGPDFLFAAKLTRTMTHEIDPTQWRDQVRRYRDGIAPLVQSKQLAAVLIQLAPSFDRSKENRVYLAALLDALNGLPVAIEFRHVAWAVDRVFDELAARQVALVAVDEPSLPGLFPPLDVVTNPNFFYIRFHGRNAAGWRSGHMQKQFDYDYSETELKEWIDQRIVHMTERAKTGIIFFNNHVRGQAPRNAQTLIRLLTDAGLMAIKS
ncbi:MAG: hypothetical protein COX19_09630 [Desulfobacterales bacterium CG23_combo_of_CG06-09_8_20_14_all_51_8]|nr:MAG: hypothetical protein COX19_09630 [Desulfobacterales bacterium CG23_combo_of_CG06-09_8_20_14_all_51_8]